VTRPLGKSLFVLLALSLWNLAGSTSLAEDDDPNGVKQLIEQGRYQEAIPIAERAVEVAKRVRGPEHPETAEALSNLGLVFEKIGDDAKAEPLYKEALRILEKTPEHPRTARSLNKLGSLYRGVHEYAKA
jgi:tetratricopeptide (TPR) repeat protein